MTFMELFPKFEVPVIYKNLGKVAGEYWHKSDVIVLDKELIKSLPGYAKIVVIHEMIHSSGSDKRLRRVRRLADKFGAYAEGSVSYKLEECIAEIGTMVIMMKMGLWNQYSKTIVLEALEKYYTQEMYIPVRELRAAIRYYAADDANFEVEIQEAMQYLDAYMDIKFQETYSKATA